MLAGHLLWRRDQPDRAAATHLTHGRGRALARLAHLGHSVVAAVVPRESGRGDAYGEDEAHEDEEVRHRIFSTDSPPLYLRSNLTVADQLARGDFRRLVIDASFSTRVIEYSL